MSAYYNEIDPFASAWLRELIKAGEIADGEVDERSIADVQPADLVGFAQCHFFAGIGGWSVALRLAGWPDDRPVWTGSCPCQPFSSAGAGAGGDDPRHLWPTWFRLVAECRPHVVFGEQVEAAIAHGWLDLVQDDLEREGYAVGPVGLPAASVGAFTIRQRLWFVAESDGRQSSDGDLQRGREYLQRPQDSMARNLADTEDADRRSQQPETGARRGRPGPSGSGADGVMADPESCDGRLLLQQRRPRQARVELERRSEVGDMGHTSRTGLQERIGDGLLQRKTVGPHQGEAVVGGSDTGELVNAKSRGASAEEQSRYLRGAEQASFWSACEWIACRDGKSRPVEPGIFPLASGIPNRVGTLRGAGNSIVPQVAAEVIRAYMEIAS